MLGWLYYIMGDALYYIIFGDIGITNYNILNHFLLYDVYTKV